MLISRLKDLKSTKLIGVDMGDDLSRFKEYSFGGREVTPTHLLLLLSEMEGTYQHLKYMGFREEMDIIDLMKKRFYKMYFQLNKQQSK